MAICLLHINSHCFDCNLTQRCVSDACASDRNRGQVFKIGDGQRDHEGGVASGRLGRRHGFPCAHWTVICTLSQLLSFAVYILFIAHTFLRATRLLVSSVGPRALPIKIYAKVSFGFSESNKGFILITYSRPSPS